MNQTEILKYLEEQKTTRTITDLIVHCTATKPGAKVNVDVIDGWHKERGFKIFTCAGAFDVSYQGRLIIEK